MGADLDIKRLDARISRMEAAARSAFRSLSAEVLPHGVHVTGVETFEARLDRVITATPAADGFSVILAVEGQETPLPPEGARSLAAALIAAAQQVDGGAA
jgi:hypothetical protein